MDGDQVHGVGMITDVPGVRVGSWTGAGTGVTVVVLPEGTIGSGEIRGGAPATRETALLDPIRTIQTVDAVVITGGSVFGLATADGVVAHLAATGRGLRTTAGPVPVVPTAAIYDLGRAECAPPGPAEGRAALDAADAGAPVVAGRHGAGRGARLGTWRGREHAVAGGLGSASTRVDGATVGALVVVNAVGDVVDDGGEVLAGSTAPPGTPPFPDAPLVGEHTTIVCLATDARCTKVECHLLAQSAHHGLARALHPSHTRYDGDFVVAVAVGAAEANLDRLRVAATAVVAQAVRSAVRADA